MKLLVYADKLGTIDALEKNIRRVIVGKPLGLLQKTKIAPLGWNLLDLALAVS